MLQNMGLIWLHDYVWWFLSSHLSLFVMTLVGICIRFVGTFQAGLHAFQVPQKRTKNAGWLTVMWVKQNKPPIWEWFIPPIYGDLGDGLWHFMTMFYPHQWFHFLAEKAESRLTDHPVPATGAILSFYKKCFPEIPSCDMLWLCYVWSYVSRG